MIYELALVKFERIKRKEGGLEKAKQTKGEGGEGRIGEGAGGRKRKEKS